MKSEEFTEVFTIYLGGGLKVCTKFHVNSTVVEIFQSKSSNINLMVAVVKTSGNHE